MHPGDQHKGLANPFDETKISAYTAIEIATLQAKLDQQLGPEFISSRPGPSGKKIHYLQADKCINLANEVFGFNGWSSTVKGIELDFLDQKDGKWNIGLSVTVRITLKDGTFHEDVGYGTMDNGKTKAQVFEKAKKEGTTDALKRALRNFGNVLGNCLHDKDYMGKVVKLKVPPHRFDEKKLHRHREFTPQIKKEPLVGPADFSGPPSRDSTVFNPPIEERPQESPENFDEYGGDEFEELGIFGGGSDPFDDLMPDEIAVDFSDESVRGPTPPNAPTVTNMTKGQYNSGYANPSANRQNLQTPQPQRIQQVSHNAITLKPQQPQPQPLQPQQSRPVQPPQFRQPQAQPANQRQPVQRPQPGPPQVPRVPPPQGGFQGSPTPVRAQPPTNHGTNFRNVQQGINQRGHPPPQQQQQNQQPQKSPPSVPMIAAPQLTGPETPTNPPPQNPPVGFFSGRAVVNMEGEHKLIPDQALAFNPHHQTSIPRSHGIDHSKSSPIPRKVLSGPQGPAGGAYVRPNFENPSLSTNRQIGMPPQARGAGSFRQPGPAAGVKRPAEVTAQGGNNFRPTLGDASGANLNKQAAPNFGNETKRQARMS